MKQSKRKGRNLKERRVKMCGNFTDNRDGTVYGTVKIGRQVWMAENLNYESAKSRCLHNDPAYSEKYGRLYSWYEAPRACPVGWHIPGDAEWERLVNFVGGRETAGKALKSTTGWLFGNGVDKYGFSALPGGTGTRFEDYGSSGVCGSWWSATDKNDGFFAWCRYMKAEYDGVYRDNFAKTVRYSVRCVKDAPFPFNIPRLIRLRLLSLWLEIRRFYACRRQHLATVKRHIKNLRNRIINIIKRVPRSKGMTATFNRINPFSPGYGKLAQKYGGLGTGDEVFSFREILDLLGIKYTIWYFNAVKGFEREKRLFAVWCAKRTEHLMTDERSLQALRLAELYADGKATETQRIAAWSALLEAADGTEDTLDEAVEKYAARSVLYALSEKINETACPAADCSGDATAYAAVRDQIPYIEGAWYEDFDEEIDIDRIIREAALPSLPAEDMDDSDMPEIPERIITLVNDTRDTAKNAAWTAIKKEFARMLDCVEKRKRYEIDTIKLKAGC